MIQPNNDSGRPGRATSTQVGIRKRDVERDLAIAVEFFPDGIIKKAIFFWCDFFAPEPPLPPERHLAIAVEFFLMVL